MTDVPSRFRLKTYDVEGRAKIVLEDAGQPIGVINVSWPTYERLTRDVIRGLMDAARDSLASSLGPMIWQDAINACDGSSDPARKKLEELKIDQKKLEVWADALSRQFAQLITSFMPEVIG